MTTIEKIEKGIITLAEFTEDQQSFIRGLVKLSFNEGQEKASEKDYEILSIYNPTSNRVLTDSNVQTWIIKPFTRQNWEIHSVKRLSDGEVFTIGDKVNSTISDLGGFTDLTGFKLDNNKISLGLKIGSRGVGYYPLNTIIKCEKPIEKDYEILSVIYDGKVYNKSNNIFLDENTYILENALKCPIHSVKRLSDGEIFTVGDKVTCQDCIGEIKNFFFICGIINIEGIGTKDDPNMLWSFPLTELWDDMTELPQKVKKPLFTTEDGVDIYEGDEHYSVNITTFDLIKTKRITPPIDNDKRFSTKEKAEEYILMNKPCLSINDILLMQDGMLHLEKKLKELVKSKI